MKTTSERLIDWAIKKIKTEYKDDVRLLIGHSTYKLEKDKDKVPFGFFLAASKKASGLSKTFIIDGVGNDLFPMPLERMERIVALDEDNASCIADGKILYYRNEDDKELFVDLQARLQANLHNPQYTLNKALEKLNIAMGLYQTLQFEDEMYKVRKGAGYIVNFLSSGIAYMNQTYFKKYPTVSELSALKSVPDDFIRLCEAIIKANSSRQLKRLCYEMIYNTRQYLSMKKGKSEKKDFNGNFKELAGWYYELSYAWREIYHWCDQNDAVKAFLRGCFLQAELDIIGEEFGLKEFNLLGAFNASDLAAYRKRAEKLEKQIISVIQEHGAVIEVYNSIDEFLKKNA
jgi:hypothetical protein